MSEQINSNRRGFLTRLSKPVKAATSYEEKSQRLHARPPRAVDEVLFERLCDGCGLCEQACQIVSLRYKRAVRYSIWITTAVQCATNAVKRVRLVHSTQR